MQYIIYTYLPYYYLLSFLHSLSLSYTHTNPEKLHAERYFHDIILILFKDIFQWRNHCSINTVEMLQRYFS